MLRFAGAFRAGASAAVEQILYAVHVEGQREAQRLVERVALRGGNHVAHVEREHAHAEAAAHGEVLAVALVLALVVVTGAHGELVVVDILRADAPLYLLKLFLEAARGVAEALEYARDRAHVAVLLNHPRLVVGRALALFLHRHGWHEQLVGVCRDGEAVVFVDGNHHRRAYSQVGRQELAAVVAVVCYLAAHVAYVHSQPELALAVAHHEVVVVVHGQVGGECRCRRGVFGVVVAQVGVYPAYGGGNRELLAEHERVGHVHRHFVGVDGHVARSHLAEREVAQRGRHRAVVAYAVVARHVGQVDVLDELAQPRRIVERDPCAADAEGVLGRVPVLGVDVGVGGRAHVAHACGACVGGDGLRNHCVVYGVKLVQLLLCLCCGGHRHDGEHGCVSGVVLHLLLV